MVLNESGLCFDFSEGTKAIKFDDTRFYRNEFSGQPRAKGVDFIADNNSVFAMIEIKNCKGDEGNNRWRIAPNNRKREVTHTQSNIDGRDSLDIEVAEKVAMTISSLCGAGTYGERRESSKELIEFFSSLISKKYSTDAKKILVILFLEGEFASKTRTEKMILKDLQDSLNRKLKWLNCRVSVENTNTYSRKLFNVS